MNCKNAREIVNILMDGEEHAQGWQARVHMDTCQDCLEWYQSMTTAIGLIDDSSDLPEIDISAAVMAKLPKQHPYAQKAPVVKRKTLLAWIGASWAAGFAVLVLAAAVVMLRMPDIVTEVHQYRIGLAATLDAFFTSIPAALRAIGLTAGDVISKFGIMLFQFRYGIIGFVAADSAALAMAAWLWMKRKRVTKTVMLIA